MRWWVEAQLKAAILTDLKELVPNGYFDLAENQITLDKNLDATGHLSKELCWGNAAGRLGHSLYFKNNKPITPRQLAAAEVLMNLGILVGAKAAQESCASAKDYADGLGVPDGNSGNVSAQLSEDHIPTLENNLNGSLAQYLKHLPEEDRFPYISLLNKNGLIELGIKEKARDKITRLLSENLIKVTVSVVTLLLGAALLYWLDFG